MKHNSKKDIRSLLFFLLALLTSVSIIYQTLPPETDYRKGADEGTYYHQAKTIRTEGWSGFKTLATEYVTNEHLQIFPPPERIAHILFASIALKFSDSYRSLSLLSLLFFAAHAIVCFYFLRKFFSDTIALGVAVLICFSPLSMGLARRALSDTGYYLFVTMSVFSFVTFLLQPDKRRIALFTISYATAILVKESALFLLPFFAGAVVSLNFFLKKDIDVKQSVIALTAPLLVVVSAYFVTFGSQIFDIFEVTNKINRTTPHLYVLQFNSGPWYQYFVDYFVLSPVVSILFFLFTGYFLLNPSTNHLSYTLLLGFYAWFLFIFSFLPMNVRYAQPLDFVYRTGAVLLLAEGYERIRQSDAVKTLLIVSTVASMLLLELLSFKSFFVKNNIYDPISYNLFQAENFFNFNQPTAEQEEPQPVSVPPANAQDFLNKSFEYYRNGHYRECIAEAEKALAIKPDFAEAYNNICSAYNQLNEWDKAIEAGNRALAINPNYQLARNNVNWAISQKQAR